MGKAYAWLIAGAVIATAGVAHAQGPAAVAPVTADRAAQRDTPWYERFTTSTGLTENLTPAGQSSERLPAPTWQLTDRWGVSVDIREGQRLDQRLEGGREDQTAVGAYYQFTPSVRVGGEVSVGMPQQNQALTTTHQSEKQEPTAGVRLESAFRF
ncbi:MAG: NtrZ family periplasmic regulatory protein [Pseudomonadota bacterium]